MQGFGVTLLVSIAIIGYSTLKFLSLVDFGETNIMVFTKESFFVTEDQFTTDDGLMIAFGITAYDENYESIEDPDYGDLKAYYKTWGFENAPGEEFTEIPSSFCTHEQLGINEDGT